MEGGLRWLSLPHWLQAFLPYKQERFLHLFYSPLNTLDAIRDERFECPAAPDDKLWSLSYFLLHWPKVHIGNYRLYSQKYLDMTDTLQVRHNSIGQVFASLPYLVSPALICTTLALSIQVSSMRRAMNIWCQLWKANSWLQHPYS